MGERAVSDRRMHRPIRLPEAVREGSAILGLGAALPVLTILCCVVLAACATTDDGIAARREREARRLREAEVWKSPATQIEPQVMASVETKAPARASGIAEDNAGSRARLDRTPAPEASEAAAETTGAAAIESTTTELATPTTEATSANLPSWMEIPDEELIRELLLRKLKQWESQAGGYSHASHLAPDGEEQRLARDLVTLSFLSGGRPLDETGLEAAAMTLGATGDREDLLRAALALQQLGRTGESREILLRLTGEDEGDSEPPQVGRRETARAAGTIETIETAAAAAAPASIAVPEAAALSGTPAFELVSVTFASRIDGPGDFVAMPAEAIQPGKEILVYGEFAGFRTIEQRTEAGDQPTHSRAFSASLRLQDAERNVLEELKFLPPSRGRQAVHDPGEAVNFWARYQIPDTLSAGRYQIVINAEDHLGGQSATAELSFEVR